MHQGAVERILARRELGDAHWKTLLRSCRGCAELTDAPLKGEWKQLNSFKEERPCPCSQAQRSAYLHCAASRHRAYAYDNRRVQFKLLLITLINRIDTWLHINI